MDTEAGAPPQTIARTIRHRRRQLGLSQTEAAALAGVSRQALSEIERGAREGRDQTIRGIEEALQLPTGSLLALRADPPADTGLGTIRRELIGMVNELTSVQVMEQVRLDIIRRRMAALQSQLAEYEGATDDDEPDSTQRAAG